MFANRKGHRGNVVIITVVACLLTAARTWGAESPGERPEARAGAALPAGPDADDLALILRRLKVDFANPNSNYPHDAHGVNYSRASKWLSSLAADGHWPDIGYEPRPAQTKSDYANPATPNRYSNAHLSRVAQMASAYANPDSPDYHSPQMLDGVERGLQRWYQGHPLSDNWWDNTIGVPLLLSHILVPLEDVLPADLLRQGVSYLVVPADKDPTYSRAALSYPQQQLIRGALARSAADMAAASEEMQRIIRIRTDEGIQRDFSFHQHGPQLYDGGYGLTLMVDIINYATVLRGTRYAFAHDKLALLADHLLEGSGHMIRGKALDYSAFGRTLLRRNAGQSAVEFVALCDQLAALIPERAGQLIALKEHIEGTGSPYSFLGNRYFWNSDFMTHQREAYYISVKMVSYRTVGTETIHGENAKGCWLPFGATWILRRGDEYNSILRVLDWGRLPGVTSPHMTTPPVRNVSQPEGFVGGVSDGAYGAAAMVFEQTEALPLTPRLKISTWGRKAWFFFDREMVAMGAGIGSSRDEPVGTTLNQTGLHGPVLIDGHAAEPGEAKVQQSSWLLHDEVGYAFLGPADASVKAGPQSVFTLWIDHGVHPRDAQYAYVVLPGINAQQLAEWREHPPVRVIANTPEQQAVINDRIGVAEIVFYRPGKVTLAAGVTVKVDHPCLVLLAKQGNSTRIAVSSPGGEFFTVHLSITTSQKEQSVAFELPSGDMAGKSQVLEVPVTW